jgi:hypothetical protein
MECGPLCGQFHDDEEIGVPDPKRALGLAFQWCSFDIPFVMDSSWFGGDDKSVP